MRILFVAVVCLHAASSSAQSVQYRSPAGVEYRSQADTGAIARAEAALAADPRNVEKVIALGIAQSNARQFREAIATFSRGLEIAPNNAILYRWRGHRYLSIREFDRALEDFNRGARIDSTVYGIWYHLGIIRFARGEFALAADAFARAQPRAPDAGELAGSTDWLWMSLSRAGRAAEARAMLARRPDSLPVNNAYTRRLKLYRGEIGPDEVFTPADTADVQVATLSYGLGNWYLVRGDTARARASFERSVRSGGWPGFGFIISEVELRRLGRGATSEGVAAQTGTPAPTYRSASGATLKLLLDDSNVGAEVTVGELTFPSNTDSGEHAHGSIEMFYVLSGELEHVVNGKSQILKPGMTGHVRPPDKIRHKTGPAGAKVIVIWVPGDEAKRIVSRWTKEP